MSVCGFFRISYPESRRTLEEIEEAIEDLLAHFLPSFVHPDPLFGMAEDDALEDFVEAFCILPNNVSRTSPSVRTSTGGSKRRTCVPSGSRQLEEGITGAPVNCAYRRDF